MKTITKLLVASALFLTTQVEAQSSLKQRNKQAKARKAYSSSAIPDNVIGRTFVGLDGNLQAGYGLSVGNQLSEQLQLQGIIGPLGIIKPDEGDATTSFDLGLRLLWTIDGGDDLVVKAGGGVIFTDNGSSDLLFEAPVRFEYYLNDRFSIHFTSGALLDLDLLQEGLDFRLALGNGGAGLSLWL